MLAMTLNILLAVLAFSMLLFGRFGATRQAALIPLAMAVLDASFAGLFSHTGWSVVAIALQMLVLAVSGVMLYQDALRAKQKQARRRRRQEIARSRAAFEQALERRQRAEGQRRVCA